MMASISEAEFERMHEDAASFTIEKERPTIDGQHPERVSTASGIVRALRDGLAMTGFEALASLVGADRADRATMLLCAGEVSEASRLAEEDGATSGAEMSAWKRTRDKMRVEVIHRNDLYYPRPCQCLPRCALLWLAARYGDPETVSDMSCSHSNDCVYPAILNAVAADRVATLEALLVRFRFDHRCVANPITGPAITVDVNIVAWDAAMSMWQVAGRYRAARTIEFFLDASAEGHDAPMMDAQLRSELRKRGQRCNPDNGDWVSAVAESDWPGALDICRRREIPFHREAAVRSAVFYGSASFVQRFVELFSESTKPFETRRMVDSIRYYSSPGDIDVRIAISLLDLPYIRSDENDLWLLRALKCAERADIENEIRLASGLLQKLPELGGERIIERLAGVLIAKVRTETGLAHYDRDLLDRYRPAMPDDLYRLLDNHFVARVSEPSALSS